MTIFPIFREKTPQYVTEHKFFKFRNSKKVQSDEEHISIIMNRKNPANTKYATWVVSNCESTSGASQRFQYAQRLVSATDFTILIFFVSINFHPMAPIEQKISIKF